MYRIKVNAAGLRLLSLERLGCKAGPWLASGNFNEKQFPTLTKLTLNDRCASTVCTNNMVYAEHLLSFLEYRIWVLAMQGMTTWLASSKKPWTLETLMKYWQHLTCLVIICY